MPDSKLTIYAPRGTAVEVPEVNARVRIQFAAGPWAVVDLLAPPSACPDEVFTLLGTTSSESEPVYESVLTVNEHGVDQLGARTTLRFKNLVKEKNGAAVSYTLYRGEGDTREAIVEGACFEDIANRSREAESGGDGAEGWVEAETIATLAPVSVMKDQTLFAPENDSQEEAPPPLPEVQDGALYGDRSTAVKAKDCWVYVFTPTWKMDGEEATVSWTAREYQVDSNGKYTRSDFREETTESGARDAMMLPVAVTDSVASPAVWVSPFRLPKAHVEGALRDERTRRDERSPSALTPIELTRASLGQKNKRGWKPADGRLQEMEDGGYQLHVVDLRTASKDLHTLYSEYYEECSRWKKAAGSTHQLTSLLSSLLKSRRDLENEIVGEAFDWVSRYNNKKKAVLAELNRRGSALCKLLRSRSVRLALQQHEMDESTKEAGEAWIGALLRNLSECEPGQKLLIDTLYSSSLAKGADGSYTPETSGFNTEATGFEAELAPDAVATTRLSDFNYLSQIFGVGRKSTKKYFGIVEEISVVIPAAYAADKDGGKVAAHLFAALLSKREGTDRNNLTRLRGGTIGGDFLVIEKKTKQRSYTRARLRSSGKNTRYIIRDAGKFEKHLSERGLDGRRIDRIKGLLDIINAVITLVNLADEGVQSNFEALEVTGTMLGTMQTLGASSRGALGSEAIQESLGRLTTAIFLFTNSVNTGRQVANGEYLEATATGLNAASNAISLAAKYGSDSARVVIGGRLLALSRAVSTTLNVVSLVITAGIIAYNIRKAYRKDKPWVWVTDHCLWSRQPERIVGADFTPRHLPGSMAESQEKAGDLVAGGWKLENLKIPASYEEDVSHGIQTFYPTLFSQFKTKVDLGDRPGIDPLYKTVRGMTSGQHYAQPRVYAEAGRSRPLFINLSLPEGPIPPAGTVLVRLAVRSVLDGEERNWLFRVGYEISQRKGGSASGYLQETYFDRYVCWGGKSPVAVPDLNGTDGHVKLKKEMVEAFPSPDASPLARGEDARHACLAFAPKANPYVRTTSAFDEGIIVVPQLRDHVVIPNYTDENPSLVERALIRTLKVTCTSWVLLPGHAGQHEALRHTCIYDMAKERQQ